MISILGNSQPFKLMLKYQVSLHVQNLNFILILGSENSKLSEKGTTNVAIYAFFAGKFLDVTKYACVKDLTNIMSVWGLTNVALQVQYRNYLPKPFQIQVPLRNLKKKLRTFLIHLKVIF